MPFLLPLLPSPPSTLTVPDKGWRLSVASSPVPHLILISRAKKDPRPAHALDVNHKGPRFSSCVVGMRVGEMQEGEKTDLLKSSLALQCEDSRAWRRLLLRLSRSKPTKTGSCKSTSKTCQVKKKTIVKGQSSFRSLLMHIHIDGCLHSRPQCLCLNTQASLFGNSDKFNKQFKHKLCADIPD